MYLILENIDLQESLEEGDYGFVVVFDALIPNKNIFTSCFTSFFKSKIELGGKVVWYRWIASFILPFPIRQDCNARV